MRFISFFFSSQIEQRFSKQKHNGQFEISRYLVWPFGQDFCHVNAHNSLLLLVFFLILIYISLMQ